MVGLQEKAIENLLCLIPTKVFMRKNEKSISSSILRSIFWLLGVLVQIFFFVILQSKVDPNNINTFFKESNTRPKYFDTTVKNVDLMLSVDLDCTNVNSSSTSNNTEGEIPIWSIVPFISSR